MSWWKKVLLAIPFVVAAVIGVLLWSTREKEKPRPAAAGLPDATGEAFERGLDLMIEQTNVEIKKVKEQYDEDVENIDNCDSVECVDELLGVTGRNVKD